MELQTYGRFDPTTGVWLYLQIPNLTSKGLKMGYMAAIVFLINLIF